MRKKIILSVVAIIILTVSWGIYNFRKPHTNVAALKAEKSLTAEELYTQFEQNENSANKIFVDKILEVKGNVIAIEHTDSTANIQLESGEQMGNINCGFVLSKDESIKLPSKKDQIVIKGRCTGYLVDVNLVDCVIEK